MEGLLNEEELHQVLVAFDSVAFSSGECFCS